MQLLNDDVTQPLSINGQHLGNRILAGLAKHYPHMADGWTVTMKEKQGVVQVTNNLLSGRMGFVMHITKIDPELKSVMRAGGELLERYRILRAAPSKNDIHAAMKNARFARSGQMIADK